MGRAVLVALGLAIVCQGNAQTFSEWFRQNSTRLKYYGKQIAALQLYLGELEKGYEIAGNGLSAIGGSKQGELDIHSDYYASLDAINPAVGQLDEVAEIAELQAKIIQRFKDALGRYRRDGLLGLDRIAYVVQVYTGVLDAGLADVQELTEVLTAGDWQMTDDQRVSWICKVARTMKDRYFFTLAFIDRTDMLERQLGIERGEMGVIKGLYGIP